MDIKTFLEVTPEEEKLIKNFRNLEPEEIEKSVEVIQEWYKKQPHLPQVTDENLYRQILIKNNGNIEKSKFQIDNYYKVRSLMPDFFSKRNMKCEAYENYFKAVTVVPLPKLTKDLCRIIFVCFKDTNSDLVDPILNINYILATLEALLHNDAALGEYLVVDCRNCTHELLVKFPPSLLKRFVSVILSTYSDRIKGVYSCFLSSASEETLDIFLGFMNAKNPVKSVKAVDLDELYSHISKEYLPEDVGGTQKPSAEELEKWKKCLEIKNDWFLEQGNLKSDESLRDGEPPAASFLGNIPSYVRQISMD